MRLDRNAKWTAFFCGGSTSLCLEVKQFRVDLKKKKKEKKMKSNMFPRSTGLAVCLPCKCFFFCYLFLFG